VWFDDGTNGSLLLAPDQRIAAVGYAMVAGSASQVLLQDVWAASVQPVFAWGRNQAGQTSVKDSLGSVAAIAAGGEFSLALLGDGTVEAWGDDGSGQATVPGGLTQVTQVSAGLAHALARKSDGTVEAWGSDS
jgi:alpha-tubulin suppressor-like RCC1 family protein